jgi:hypothetical protein
MRLRAIQFIGCWTAILSTIPMTYGAEFAGGTGTPGAPYQIGTAEQLISIGSDPNLLDKCFVLTADIDLDPRLPGGGVFNEAVIAPDVKPSKGEFRGTPFSGTFHGQSHTIRNLRIDLPSDVSGEGCCYYLGLFGSIGSGGAVTDLCIADANITRAHDYAGVLAGCNEGTVDHCNVSGSISGRYGVGGLIGHNRAGVSRCASACMVTGVSDVGGLIGGNEGSLDGCISASTVTGADERIGGLAGASDGPISRCDSYGTVTGLNEETGGLVAVNSNTLSDCRNFATVNGDDRAGGLVSFNTPTAVVLRCASSGAVNGSTEVGGACARTVVDLWG